MEIKFKRVDAHSPGAIVPADYRAVLVYTRTNSDERYEALVEEHEELGLNWERACELLKTVPFFKHPRFDTDLLKCQVCGARFLTGQIWKHLPTGEHVILGCDCAGKYGLEMDLTEVELYKKRVAEASRTSFGDPTQASRTFGVLGRKARSGRSLELRS